MEFCPCVCENAKWPATIQCIGRIKRRHERSHHDHERYLHHVGSSLRTIKATCKKCDCAYHARLGQCPLPAMSFSGRACKRIRNRTVVSTPLFAQSESH